MLPAKLDCHIETCTVVGEIPPAPDVSVGRNKFLKKSWILNDTESILYRLITPEREVRGSRPTAAVLCPWARHFTPRKYWLITQEAMAPSRHDWKIVDWDVKPQHNQPTID